MPMESIGTVQYNVDLMHVRIDSNSDPSKFLCAAVDDQGCILSIRTTINDWVESSLLSRQKAPTFKQHIQMQFSADDEHDAD